MNLHLIILLTCRIISYVFKKYESAIKTTDKNIAHGAHERIYSSGASDATKNISHAPFISTNHLIKITVQLLETYGPNKGVDSKSHQRVGCDGSSSQRIGSNGQLRDTLEDLLLCVPFKIGSCAMITLMGIKMQR